MMDFLKFFHILAASCLLFRIARADARSLRIPPRENCVLAACSLARVISSPAGWASSLLAAVLFCALFTAADLLMRRRRGPESGRFPAGGGDIKLIFSLLLQTDLKHLPLWAAAACVYILLTRIVWPEKRKLPLGPALAGAGILVLLL